MQERKLNGDVYRIRHIVNLAGLIQFITRKDRMNYVILT